MLEAWNSFSLRVVALSLLCSAFVTCRLVAADSFQPGGDAEYQPELVHPAWKTNRLEACRVLPEFQPAERDPGGNWGPITNGLQLSVRLSNLKPDRSGASAFAIILRNHNTYSVTIVKDYGWDWAVAREPKASLTPESRKPGSRYTQGPPHYSLGPRSQIKWLFRMGSPLTLFPGRNYVAAGSFLFVQEVGPVIIRSGVMEVDSPSLPTSPTAKPKR